MNFLSFALLFALFGFQNDNCPADRIIGVWKLENQIDLKIYKYHSKYYGKIIALNGFNDGQILDSYNPKDKFVKDSLIGKVILSGLEYNQKEKKWQNGKMYAPNMGFFANLEIENVSSTALTAVGSKFMFWHTEHWQKQ
jgi:hypothetical protein